MPGILNSNSTFGFNREVGKMASFFDPDLIQALTEDEDISEIATRILMDPSSAGSSSGGDSDGELPDNEHTVDLIDFIDCQDHLDVDMGNVLHHLKCSDDNCSKCANESSKLIKYGVRKDPFMGMGAVLDSPTSTLSSSSQMTHLDCDYDLYMKEQIEDLRGFKAWGHTPKKDDDLLFTSTICDDTEDNYFPDTPSPSSRSGTATGDDSDVDIETVTDTPRGADSCGYATHDSSPALSPSSSPGMLHTLQNGSLLSILATSKSESSNSSTQSSLTSSKQISLSSYGVSSRLSLAENLLSGRSSLLGQKRKLSKDRKCMTKIPAQPAYTHVLCNSNSVNFHDYAMSPGACAYPSVSSPSTSTETGRPTVLSKRIYKRKQVSIDASDKEKQHHHNQLERNRRQKLADLFVDLRDEVPKIANQAKASKVVILNESTLYIRELQRKDKHQEEELTKEYNKKEMLRKQLQQLKAQLSRTCVK